MTAKRDVEDRLVAATGLLSNLIGTECFDQVSRAQASAIQQMITDRSFQLGELAELSTTARESAFAASDKSIIMKAISEKAASSSGGSAKLAEKKKQNYTNIPHLLTQDLWDTLASEDGPSKLFEHAMALGARDLDEHSYAMFAILIMYCTEGQEKALKLPQPVKLAQVNAVRTWFKRLASRAPPPDDRIMSLPASPPVLLGQHPRTYATVFADGPPPVACKIDVLVLEMLRQSTRCRNTLKLQMASRQAVATGMQDLALQGTQGMQGMQGQGMFRPQCPMIGDQPQQVMSMVGVALRELVNCMQGQNQGRQQPTSGSADVPLTFSTPPRQPMELSTVSGSPPGVAPPRRAEVAAVPPGVAPLPRAEVVAAEPAKSEGAGEAAVDECGAESDRPVDGLGGRSPPKIDSKSTGSRRASVAEASAAIANAYQKVKDKRAIDKNAKKAAEKEAKKLEKEKKKPEKKHIT